MTAKPVDVPLGKDCAPTKTAITWKQPSLFINKGEPESPLIASQSCVTKGNFWCFPIILQCSLAVSI